MYESPLNAVLGPGPSTAGQPPTPSRKGAKPELDLTGRLLAASGSGSTSTEWQYRDKSHGSNLKLNTQF